MYNYTPITQLPPLVSINPLDVIPVTDVTDLTASPSGTTKKVSIQQIKTYIDTANPWIIVNSGPIVLQPNQGYIIDTPVLGLLTLPVTANVGDEYYIEGLGPNLFQINQNAGQNVVFDSVSTSIGTSGYILSTDPGDGLTIMCTVANTKFKVRSSIGTLRTF
jgi:hypothetical protein